MNLKSSTWKTKLIKFVEDYSIIVAIAVLFIFFSIASPYFLTYSNIRNIFHQTCPIAIAGIGVTLITICAGYDMSIGYNVMVSGAVMSYLIILMKVNPVIAIIIALLVGTAIGALNGYVSCYIGVPSFVVTLATQLVCFGFAKITTNCTSIAGLPDAVAFIGRGYIGGNKYGIPFCVILVILLLIAFTIILKHTKFGRQIYATGGNSEAAYFSGINVKKISCYCYIICGFMAALAGIVLVSKIDSANIKNGLSYAFDTSIACTIGGVSMAGGKGNVVQSYLGSVFLTLFFNGMTLLNVNPYYQDVIKGFVLLASVILDVVRTRKNSGK